MLSGLKNVLAAVVNSMRANPAVVSYLLTLVTMLAAHYKLHVTSAQLMAIVAILTSWTHASMHISLKRTQDKLLPKT